MRGLMSASKPSNVVRLTPEGSGGSERHIEDLEPGVDLYGSRMMDRVGFPFQLATRMLFDPIENSSDLEPIRSAAREGTVVYVMRTRSLLDYLFFNHFFLKHKLPLARFANGIRTTFFAPLLPTLRSLAGRFRSWRRTGGRLPDPVDSGYLTRSLGRGESALLFLRPGRGWSVRPKEKRDLVEVLVEAQKETERPIFIVPQILVWERQPDRANRGLLDVLLGDGDTPGAFRKTLTFLLFHRLAVAHLGEPVNLKDFLDDQRGQSTERVAKKLRWLLLGYLYRERKVVKGPDVRPRRWIFQRILSEPRVKEAIATQASLEGKSLAAIEKRSRKILDRTAADFRWGVVTAFKTLLDSVTARIYNGVEFDPQDVERIREAKRKGTVVFIPSHRSHFDYLLLSWLLYRQGMMPPHVAAGNNLSFFPIGTIFRRSGAFFIRRSFADDKLYTALLTHYVRALTAEGYAQEFFIEGGRSRTGKMLRPKIGLLWTYVDAMVDRIVNDIQIVPVYIAYERIVEDYSKELSGGEKKKENAGQVLKTAGVLRRRFGRVYVTVNEPISIKESLGLLRRPWGDLSSEERKTYLNRFAKHITAEIQDVTVVTPSTVAAMILLSHDRRGMSRADFHRRGRFFRRWMEEKGARFSDAWQFPEDALDEALEMFADDGLAEILLEGPGRAASDSDIIALPEDASARMRMDYYKNNILFHFVPAALICTALILGEEGEEKLGVVRRRVDFLLDLFGEEFFFHPDLPVEVLIGEAGRSLQRCGVVQVLSSRTEATEESIPGSGPYLDTIVQDEPEALIRIAHRNRALLYLATIRNFFEAYWVVLKGSEVLESGPMSERELIESLLKAGRVMYLTEDVTMPEAITKVNITNAVRQFKRKGVLLPTEGGRTRDVILRLDTEARESYLGPMGKLFTAGRLLPPRPEA